MDRISRFWWIWNDATKTQSIPCLCSVLHDIQQYTRNSEGLMVRHKCQNKNCIAPEHLELGTAKENSSDRIRDGTTSIGILHPNATIDENTALEIYKSYNGSLITDGDSTKI